MTPNKVGPLSSYFETCWHLGYSIEIDIRLNESNGIHRKIDCNGSCACRLLSVRRTTGLPLASNNSVQRANICNTRSLRWQHMPSPRLARPFAEVIHTNQRGSMAFNRIQMHMSLSTFCDFQTFDLRMRAG